MEKYTLFSSMKNENEDIFMKADECHTCGKKYTDKDIKERDHCHITGKYRGSARQDCNFNFQLTDKIPVIFHNLRGYDSLLSCTRLVN